MALVYGIDAAIAGGSVVRPVLLGELFTGAAQLNAEPDVLVAKL